MKNLQNRLNQLYEQQAIEEKNVLQSIQRTLNDLSPFSEVKNSLAELLSSDESESYYSKKSFILLMNKTIDNIIPKPDIINQTIKVLVQKRFVDVLFETPKDKTEEKEFETNCSSADL